MGLLFWQGEEVDVFLLHTFNTHMDYTAVDRRKRMNFMINISLIEKLTVIPTGERSDFVNKAIEDRLERFQLEKAFDEGTLLQKKLKLKMTNEQLLKEIHYGRKEW